MTHSSDGHGRTRDDGPKSIGHIVGRLLARTGYDAQQGRERLEAAWPRVVPESLGSRSRPGRVRRGVLEILVSHSAVVQELGFHKADVIRRLAEIVPDEAITDIRCRLSGDAGRADDVHDMRGIE